MCQGDFYYQNKPGSGDPSCPQNFHLSKYQQLITNNQVGGDKLHPYSHISLDLFYFVLVDYEKIVLRENDRRISQNQG